MRFERATAIGLIATLLTVLAARSVSAPILVMFVSMAIFSYVVLASGQLVLRLAQASDLPPVAAWPVGIALTGGGLLILVALLPITAAVAFAMWAALIAPLDIASSKFSKREAVSDRTDLLGLILCCALTAAWCKDVAHAPAVLGDTGRFPAWVDYLLHAGVISQLGDVRAVGRGVIWLADTPWFLYHYASYTLPAVFVSPLDQPGLPLATSVWLPIGFLSMSAAAYTLGAAIAGPAGGIAALGALYLMPDASNYGLRNGFFSFHWNLLASPSAIYALGTALLALVFLNRWTITRSTSAFVLCAALIAATAFFRVHVFILLFPAWLIVVAINSQTVQRRRVLFLAVAGTLAISVVLVLQFSAHLPHQITWTFDEGRALERFLSFVHRRQEPTAYQGLYYRIGHDYGETVAFAIGILLVYPACLGVLLILYPMALFLLRGRLQLSRFDGIPLALMGSYVAVILLAPTPAHHDATDFTQRPFVLLYAVVAVWTASALVRWLSAHGQHGIRLWQMLVVGTIFALPFLWANTEFMVRPKFYWARPLAEHVIDRDLLAAADVLRKHAQPRDTFATGELVTTQLNSDRPTELVALSGVPAYLARFWIHQALGGNSQVVSWNRYQALGSLAKAQDWIKAKETLKRLNVRWYIVTNHQEPRWDTRRNQAVWSRGSVAIYDSAL